jgi:hypothetical protein
MVLERSVRQNKLAACQLEYSIKLNDSADMEIRGLMVIKQTKKTRARQRKQAIVNWKVCCDRIRCAMAVDDRTEGNPCGRVPDEVPSMTRARTPPRRSSSRQSSNVQVSEKELKQFHISTPHSLQSDLVGNREHLQIPCSGRGPRDEALLSRRLWR